MSDPDSSPDGRRVVFTTRIRNVWNIAMAGVDGSNFTMMGEGSDPTWSPDGKRIAFVRAAGRRAHVFTMDLETGAEVVQVTTGDNDNFEPTWSPQGHGLVFSSNRSARKSSLTSNQLLGDRPLRGVSYVYQLFSVTPDGTGVIQLTDGNGMNVQPHWGTDGFIYFASNQAGSFDIWRLRPTGELLPSVER
ncbi:MAG: TolB family protein [Gemmatimonadota bacterium]